MFFSAGQLKPQEDTVSYNIVNINEYLKNVD